MAHLRLSRDQAKAEAARRAADFVTRLPNCGGARLRGIHPDTAVRQSRSSKQPVTWVAVFAFDPPGGAVMDGGELLVKVDLKSGEVTLCQ